MGAAGGGSFLGNYFNIFQCRAKIFLFDKSGQKSFPLRFGDRQSVALPSLPMQRDHKAPLLCINSPLYSPALRLLAKGITGMYVDVQTV